jgi:hypothetical protein
MGHGEDAIAEPTADRGEAHDRLSRFEATPPGGARRKRVADHSTIERPSGRPPAPGLGGLPDRDRNDVTGRGR